MFLLVIHLLQILQCEVFVDFLAKAIDGFSGGGPCFSTLMGRSAGTNFISVPVSIALKVWIILAGSSRCLHSMLIMHCVPAVKRELILPLPEFPFSTLTTSTNRCSLGCWPKACREKDAAAGKEDCNPALALAPPIVSSGRKSLLGNLLRTAKVLAGNLPTFATEAGD